MEVLRQDMLVYVVTELSSKKGMKGVKLTNPTQTDGERSSIPKNEEKQKGLDFDDNYDDDCR